MNREKIFNIIFNEIDKHFPNPKAFAKKIGIREQNLYRYKSNEERLPRLDIFYLICNELNLSADELLELPKQPELNNFEREIINILRSQELSNEKKDQIQGMLKLLLKTDDSKFNSKTKK